MRTRMPLALVLAAALLTGCTAPPPAPTETSPPRPAPPASVAADLLGTWTVTDVETAKVGTVTFSAGVFTAQLPCGEITGDWASAGEAWLGIGSLTSPACSRTPWLDSSAGIVRVGETWTLVDTDGATTATLIDGVTAGATSTPTIDNDYQATPLDPAFTVGSIAGRWQVGDAYVVFDEASWDAPCGRGRFAELGDGYVLSVSPSIVRSVACDVFDPEPLRTMRTAGFDGQELVLFDSDGEETLRLTPASEGWTPCEHDGPNERPQWPGRCDD